MELQPAEETRLTSQFNCGGTLLPIPTWQMLPEITATQTSVSVDRPVWGGHQIALMNRVCVLFAHGCHLAKESNLNLHAGVLNSALIKYLGW